MGCFDTIRGRCPHCDAEVKYDIGDRIPADVAGGARSTSCPKYGTTLRVKAVTLCTVDGEPCKVVKKLRGLLSKDIVVEFEDGRQAEVGLEGFEIPLEVI